MSLQAGHLEFGYRPGTPVLRSVSIEIRPGEVVGVFGPNGSGKSTLLRCLNRGLFPQKGEVALDNQSIRDMSPREVAANIAVVPQDVPSDVPFTAHQVVELGRYAHRPSWPIHHDDRHVADHCLKRVGALDFADRPFSQLSGGERQRVTIARALAQLGKYLLLDEPAAHLDIAHQIDLYRLVRTVVSEGVGAFMICHDLVLSPLFVDRAILLDHGQIVRQGPPREVLQSDVLAEVYKVPVELAWPDTMSCLIRVGSSPTTNG